MTGTAPATAASKRSSTPAARAAAKSSSPCWAISCLLALTTGLPASSAARTYSRAGSVPPISSTIRSEAARISVEVALAAAQDAGDLGPGADRRGDRFGALADEVVEGAADRAAAEQPDLHDGRVRVSHRSRPARQVLVGLAADHHAGVAAEQKTTGGRGTPL